MKWDDQVRTVSDKLSRVLGIFCIFCFILPQKLRMMLYNALFCSQLKYCFLVWGAITKTGIDRLLNLQKKSRRITPNSPFNAPSRPLLEILSILPVNSLYNFSLTSKYKDTVTYNNRFFHTLSKLAKVEIPYNVRRRDP